ncbi:MAG TPA: hypothetical protein QF604_07970 [Candidatus Latescibacteria bacterium]|jgi:hypothetical protein|nr:hypothetical protein [Candidatus Latescibacterota bacterium]MDP7635004.1 hypothetical protein [Candidatus Latescibacterota bacterium]HJN27840.1 hypothetical protein [Candidatus Latescibacterota bacterium]
MYSAFLHLADPAPALHDDVRHAHRLASLGVWDEATGWNRLVDGIRSEAAPSSTD